MTQGQHHTAAAKRAISKGLKKARSAKKRSIAAREAWARRKALKEGPRTEQLQAHEVNPAQVGGLVPRTKFVTLEAEVDSLINSQYNVREEFTRLTREYFVNVRQIIDNLEAMALGGNK